MPRLTPEMEKAKAIALTKPVLKANLNLAEVARQRGVSRQAIQEQFHKPIVQKTLQEALDRIGITTSYKAKKFKELLEAKRIQDCDVFIKDENGKLKVNKNSNDFIEVEDNNARVATLRLLCQVQGDIKTNGEKGNGNVTVIVRVGNPDRLLTPSQAEFISSQRG